MKKSDFILTTILIAAAIILTSVLATATVGATAAGQKPAAAGKVARGKFLVDVHSYSRVRGLPISLSELARDLEFEIDQLEGEQL